MISESNGNISAKFGFIDGGRSSPEKKNKTKNNHHRNVKFGDILSFQEMGGDDLVAAAAESPQLSWRRSDATLSSGSPLLYSATTSYSNPGSAISSPPYDVMMSPWTQPSPYIKSPWVYQPGSGADALNNGLIGSLLREEGHVYSLATDGDLLYTGSESRNIRVWKNFQEFSVFKSSSGLVKAIVVFESSIFTGHQDGKIRVWRLSGDKKKTIHKRVGSLPTTRDLLKTAMNPKNYVETRRKRSVPWIKHYDAVSCLTIDADQGLLYSGSWDKTWKVWRISNSECLESVYGHDDAVNSIIVDFGLVFTGSADGTVKAWRREVVGKSPQHVLVETLWRQNQAITSMAASTPHRGGSLFAGFSDGLVRFWERRKHFMSFGGVIRGHKQAILCLASAGDLLISGSADKTICVWRRDIVGGYTAESVLSGHKGPVKCLTVRKAANDNEESWVLYSGSLDRSVKVWRIQV